MIQSNLRGNKINGFVKYFFVYRKYNCLLHTLVFFPTSKINALPILCCHCNARRGSSNEESTEKLELLHRWKQLGIKQKPWLQNFNF